MPPSIEPRDLRSENNTKPTSHIGTQSKDTSATATAQSLSSSTHLHTTSTMVDAPLSTDLTTTSNACTDDLHPTIAPDKHVPTATETMDDMPKRASLMGIPPELRVRIYEFLFAGASTKQSRDHCCNYPTDNPYYTINEAVLCRSCPPPRSQMLRVNRLIYQEAISIFYKSVEPRILLPSSDYAVQRRNVDKIDRFKGSSSEIRAKIDRAVIVGDSLWIDCPRGNVEPPNHRLKDFWPTLSSLLPHLKRARFHFDLHDAVRVDEFPFALFKGLINLPRLKEVEVETCDSTDYDYDGCWDQRMIREVQKAFAKSFAEEARRIGKKIKIEAKDPLWKLDEEKKPRWKHLNGESEEEDGSEEDGESDE